MTSPMVFLILPVTVAFAIFPGVIVLHSGSRLSPVVRPGDWRDFEPDDPGKQGFEKELAREVRKGHELFGLDLVVVARRFAQDDILVTSPARAGCAAVHLTYTRGRETPPWPRTTWYESVDAAKDALDDS